ncbi:MAG: energy-coupling factor transporter transmembrane protein EcfT [Ktedonobacteraceae bacterium]
MIELSRSITIGQYINNGSPLTRMDPRVKLLCAVILIALVSSVSSFAAFSLCLPFCIIILWLSRISALYVLRGFRPFTGLLLFIFVFQVFLYQPSPHIHQLWQWGIFTLSWASILFSILIIVRCLFLYYLVSMLMFSTSLVDLTDGTEALLSPLQKIGVPINALTMVLVIAFKFVPIFLTEVERLMKAQAARGVRFDKGNIFQRATKIGSLLIPLFISGFKRAETLSVAMEARGYGGRPGWKRSKRRVMHIQRFDVFTLVLTLVVCAVVMGIAIITPL